MAIGYVISWTFTREVPSVFRKGMLWGHSGLHSRAFQWHTSVGWVNIVCAYAHTALCAGWMFAYGLYLVGTEFQPLNVHEYNPTRKQRFDILYPGAESLQQSATSVIRGTMLTHQWRRAPPCVASRVYSRKPDTDQPKPTRISILMKNYLDVDHWLLVQTNKRLPTLHPTACSHKSNDTSQSRITNKKHKNKTLYGTLNVYLRNSLCTLDTIQIAREFWVFFENLQLKTSQRVWSINPTMCKDHFMCLWVFSIQVIKESSKADVPTCRKSCFRSTTSMIKWNGLSQFTRFTRD